MPGSNRTTQEEKLRGNENDKTTIEIAAAG
jgi:hypothetical protein